MDHKNSFRAYFMFLLAAIFLLYEMGLQVSPSVIAVDMMRDLNLSSESLGFLSGVYFFSYTLMQIPSGLLFDRLSAKWLIASACLLCAIGALFFGLTEEILYASLGRLLMGFGSSFAFVGVLVVAARWFYPSWFAFMAGATQLLAGAGALVGAYPLAHAVNYYGWRASIIALGFLGIVLSFLCLIFIKDHPQKEKTIEHAKGLSVLESMKVLVAEKQNIYGAIYSFLTWGPVLVFAGLWGVPFFVEKYHVTNMESALFISWIWIGVAVTSPIHGVISNWIKRRKVVLIISSIIGFMSSLMIIYGPQLSNFIVCFLLFLFGLACASQILAFALIKENNRPSVIGTGMGFNNMAVVLGGAILQPLVGFLMNKVGANSEGTYSLFSYAFSLAIVPLCFLLAAFISIFFIKETYTKFKYDPYQDHII